MGLSASQAKLLSITARLTDNEYHSQQLTNAKARLATKGVEAREEYQKALNSNMLIYNGFDIQGNAYSSELTPALIYQYQPLKNQYGLINTADQILVMEEDAKNFRNTNTLGEFLKRYNCLEGEATVNEKTVRNPEYDNIIGDWEEDYNDWKTKEPKKNDQIYWSESEEIVDSRFYDEFLWGTSICYSASLAYQEAQMGKTSGEIRDTKGNLVAAYSYDKTRDVYYYEWYYVDKGYFSPDYYNMENIPSFLEPKLNKKFEISGDEYHGELCYGHVFDHLLDIGEHKTSTGEQLKITYDSDSLYDEDQQCHWWENDEIKSNNRGTMARDLRSRISNIYGNDYFPVMFCCGKCELDLTREIVQASKSGDRESKKKVLLSDYYMDENGEFQTKTLYQKIVDLDYAWWNMDDLGFTVKEIYDAQQHFVEHDIRIALGGGEEFFEEDLYNEDYDKWEKQEPKKPEGIDEYIIERETIYDYEVSDLLKAQWYTNLWYRMNGSDESNRIRIKEGMEDNYEYYRKHLLEAMNTQKDEFKQAYKVLDPHFATSKSWLADVLSQGIVVMSRIQNDEINTANKYKWNEIIHTDASELTIESDQDAIARAEAQYEQTMHEIQTKDKRFQLEINKLDSEHNALQTQIESIRSEIAKNIERSFKTFS